MSLLFPSPIAHFFSVFFFTFPSICLLINLKTLFICFPVAQFKLFLLFSTILSMRKNIFRQILFIFASIVQISSHFDNFVLKKDLSAFGFELQTFMSAVHAYNHYTMTVHEHLQNRLYIYFKNV